MKNITQIKNAIKLNKELLKYIPEFSFSGEENHKKIKIEIYALNLCLSKTSSEIQDLLDEKLKLLEIIGEEWCDNSEVRVYDWVLEKTDEVLISKKEVYFWRKNKNEKH